jgi:glycosyltransferase involved in cell wall biosynthesis
MTTSAEPRSSAEQPEGPLSADWRAQREADQQAALPGGAALVSCSAPYGSGGLGRHLREIADALERRGQPVSCICGAADPPRVGPPNRELRVPAITTALDPLIRLSPGWSTWKAGVVFDAQAARALPPAEQILAFNGQALAQFRAASRARYSSLSLVSATSHLRRVLRQYERAYRQYPIERSWAGHLLRRNLAEYARADRIYVSSEHVRESFLEEGFAAERLTLFPLTPDPRYTPEPSPPASSTFDVVYVGSLSVAKGVPLLVQAFGRLAHADLRLVLVGGFGTRGMRRFIEAAQIRDPRVRVELGDPLAHLRAARLCVHPSYEDGFAYAPAEALACDVPVLVSDSTGMKDMIDAGRNGMVLATGDPAALTDAIEAAYRGELLGG